ncbi:response regulator transcription factor [Nocardioides sp. C4-1]|uniref:response regulator transcription factor n=1 Tax=Nocardioides sp. C4-1 TaxID=3151851 RepID=UPI003267E1E7
MGSEDHVDASRPVRVAIVNDYEIVVAGIAAVLEPYAERVQLVELTAGLPVVSEVDVVLYDTFAQRQDSPTPPDELVGDRARLVVFSWDGERDLVAAALDNGASGYVSKGVTASELVDALERVHAGERVVSAPTPGRPGEAGGSPAEIATTGRWPGDDFGLSARESEVLALICRGLSNEEITAQAYIGINTVKTHIRTLYRKIGVSRRTQAVLWGHAHGFEPDRARDLGP